MPDSRSGDPGSKASTVLTIPAGAPETTLERIIIVTGTPGVGKSSLAEQIAGRTGSELLIVGSLVKSEKLYKRFDESTRSYIIDEGRLRRRLSDSFQSRQGKRIVLETHWLGRFMPKRPGMVAVVVRLDPVILARRLRARAWPKKKIWENVEAELIDLSLFEAVKFLGARRVYQFDATGMRSRELVSKVLRALSVGKSWNGVTPNWLSKYDPIRLSRRIL